MSSIQLPIKVGQCWPYSCIKVIGNLGINKLNFNIKLKKKYSFFK